MMWKVVEHRCSGLRSFADIAGHTVTGKLVLKNICLDLRVFLLI